MKVMGKGIDYASKNNSTESNLAAIKEAGYSFIGRYYGESDWKRLTKAEAQRISKAGLYIVALYQDNARDISDFTESKGKAAAKSAISQAVNIGQPFGTPIYFAVDMEVVTVAQRKAVISFFTGIKEVFDEYKLRNNGVYEIGVYGGYETVTLITEHFPRSVSFVFQTVAWSPRPYKSRDLYQSAIDKTLKLINGSTIKVDFCESTGSAGGFQVK